jgi:hypothetical protein
MRVVPSDMERGARREAARPRFGAVHFERGCVSSPCETFWVGREPRPTRHRRIIILRATTEIFGANHRDHLVAQDQRIPGR